MTQPSQPPEYIIDDGMLACWRSGCINWQSQEDSKCNGCLFKGKGSRKDCCDFDDDAMQRIFQSHPHTSTQDGCAFRAAKLEAMYDNGYIDASSAIRNATLDEVMQKIDQRFNDTERGRKIIETCKEVIKSLRTQSTKEQP